MLLACPTWEGQRDLRCIFPVICEAPDIDIQYVYPLQQRAVCRIHEALKNDNRVIAVVLFGSSVNLRCTKNSDLDLVVRLADKYINNSVKSEVSETIQEAADWNADVLWFDRIHPTDRIYDSILKGVRIV
ncbi:MAG: nucleotidyltransferase domain-containing protein [Clostridium sp.]|nr:nucleotidyltransferase domain-containing protein [Clostridium sp.]